MIVNLHFIAIVDGHPFPARLYKDSNEDAGIVIEVAHLVDHTDAAITQLALSPIQQAHPAMRSNEAIFDGHVAGADVFPAGEILAVEERFPCGSLRLRGGNGEQS